MSQQAINLCLSVFLLVGGLASTGAETSRESNGNTSRDQLIDAITEDYLKLLDYEMVHSSEFFQNVLDDTLFQDVRSEILVGKKLVLKDFVEQIAERRMKKLPPKAHKAARFFHIFGKSLLYKEFVDIVARLDPTKSRYDRLIEDALLAHGIEQVMNAVDRKRNKFVSDTVRRIDEYVSGLPREQRRKAAAQKLSDLSLKMKENEKLGKKLEIFREFLRYEYLEATPLWDAE